MEALEELMKEALIVEIDDMGFIEVRDKYIATFGQPNYDELLEFIKDNK